MSTFNGPHFQRDGSNSKEFDLAASDSALAAAVERGDEHAVAAHRIRHATALQYADRHDEAVIMFQRALDAPELAAQPYRHFALQHLGKCLVEMGRTQEALASFHAAMAVRVLLNEPGLVASCKRAIDGANGLSMVRVGVGAITEREGRVLMARRCNVHGSGTWSTPGGHLEFGESPEACAVRETFEETGVEVAEGHLITVTNDVLQTDGRHYVTLWMRCDHLRGDGAPVATDELDEVAWFTWDALPSPLFQPFEAMLASGVLPK